MVDVTHDGHDRRPRTRRRPVGRRPRRAHARLASVCSSLFGDVLDLPAELAGEDLRRVGVERRVDVDVGHAHREELHQELGRLEAHLR